MSHRRNDAGVMCEVLKFTTSCSGCFELGDYGSGSENYMWDEKAQCYRGDGCHECGYTGKRRETLYIPLTEISVAAMQDGGTKP